MTESYNHFRPPFSVEVTCSFILSTLKLTIYRCFVSAPVPKLTRRVWAAETVEHIETQTRLMVLHLSHGITALLAACSREAVPWRYKDLLGARSRWAFSTVQSKASLLSQPMYAHDCCVISHYSSFKYQGLWFVWNGTPALRASEVCAVFLRRMLRWKRGAKGSKLLSDLEWHCFIENTVFKIYKYTYIFKYWKNTFIYTCIVFSQKFCDKAIYGDKTACFPVFTWRDHPSPWNPPFRPFHIHPPDKHVPTWIKRLYIYMVWALTKAPKEQPRCRWSAKFCHAWFIQLYH